MRQPLAQKTDKTFSLMAVAVNRNEVVANPMLSNSQNHIFSTIEVPKVLPLHALEYGVVLTKEPFIYKVTTQRYIYRQKLLKNT